MSKQCHVCNLQLVDEYAYNGHLQGKKHLLNVQRARTQSAIVNKSIFVQGPLSQHPQIVDFFSTFGRIDRWQAGPRFLIVEFVSPEPANFLIQNPIRFCGVHLQIKPRILYNQSQGPAKTKKQGKANKDDDSEWNCESIASELENMSTFDQQLSHLLRTIELTEEEIHRDYESICVHLDNYFRQLYPAWKTQRFGSTVSGLCFKKSDLDIFVDLGALNVHEDYVESAKLKFFNKVKKAMFSKRSMFDKVTPIPRAKTPIIKFVFAPKNISCDLSFKTSLGIHNSRLIRHCLNLDARLRPTMMLIKFWAKNVQLTRSGRISNYSMVMMLIFYLQQPGVALVPPIDQLKRNCEPLYVDGWQVNFDPNSNLPNVTNKSTIPELLHGFFKFYATFKFQDLVICLLDGMAHAKSTFKEFKSPPNNAQGENDDSKQDQATADKNTRNVMAIQDPFELNHNITSGVPGHVRDSFRQSCAGMVQICDKTMLAGETQRLLPQMLRYKLPKVAKHSAKPATCQIVIPIAANANGRKRDEKASPENDGQENGDQENGGGNKYYDFDRVLSCVSKVFERVLKLQIDANPAPKQLKVEANADVHSSHHENRIVWRCTTNHCLWRGKARKSVKVTGHMSELERESYISDKLVESQQGGGGGGNNEQGGNSLLLDFKCNLEKKTNPDSVVLTLANQNVDKKTFCDMISFARSKVSALIIKELETSQ